MRFIRDDDRRLLYVSFGADITCEGQTCTEFVGSAPTGYASLEAWYLSEQDKLYRWQVYDAPVFDGTAIHIEHVLSLDEAAEAPEPDKLATPIELGGTNATTAEDARRNLGVAAAWDLLWENATPEAEFPAQTLDIPCLGNFNAWLVIARQNTTNARQASVIVYAGTVDGVVEDTVDGILTSAATDQHLYAVNRERGFSITRSTDTIQFTTGYIGGQTRDNSPATMIPLYVFGTSIDLPNTTAVLGKAILGKMVLGKGG